MVQNIYGNADEECVLDPWLSRQGQASLAVSDDGRLFEVRAINLYFRKDKSITNWKLAHEWRKYAGK